jgi:putative tryptophan/tyrosine transport system substrate-binding protein
VRRRDFIGLIGIAAAWPRTARAQQADKVTTIGFLSTGGAPNPSSLAAFRQGLSEMGFADGRNLAIEIRGAERYDQLAPFAADLVRREVAAIFAWGSANAALAAKAATTAIPIVFVNGSDPVKSGIVDNINRPTGNVTGVSYYNSGIIAKRLEVLSRLAPGTTTIGFLNNPTILTSKENLADMEMAAAAVGRRFVILNASNEDEINTAFAKAAEQHIDALLVGPDPTFTVRRTQIVGHAERLHIPANYFRRAFCDAGGLSSYGADFAAVERQAGVYVGRILKGEKPADLPVQQPIKFEMVLNLKAAKTLGLTIPPTILALADEVIE